MALCALSGRSGLPLSNRLPPCSTTLVIQHSATSLISYLPIALGVLFHDDRKEAFVQETDIPQICDRHGVDWRTLIDERRCRRCLDQPAPRLCADRVDYAFRDAMSLGLPTWSRLTRLCEILLRSMAGLHSRSRRRPDALLRYTSISTALLVFDIGSHILRIGGAGCATRPFARSTSCARSLDH